MRNPESTAQIAGHPIHPMLIPFPIACFVLTLLSDLAFWKTSNEFWSTASLWLLGIGLIASIAFEKADSRRLRFLDASHLFESSVTTVGVHRNSYLTRYMQDFIRLVLPGIDRATIDATMAARQLQRRAAR